jgi:hypothetical protein
VYDVELNYHTLPSVQVYDVELNYHTLPSGQVYDVELNCHTLPSVQVYDVELNYHYVSRKAGAAQLTSTVQLTTKGSRFRCAAFKQKSFCGHLSSPFNVFLFTVSVCT